MYFYNGREQQPERKEYRLSDAYKTKTKDISLELVVTQLNINQGYNDRLMEKCPDLFQYMQYVSKIREYNKEMPLEAAVTRTVDECISEGILREFLLQNKAEVVSMTIFEYDAELHMKMEREEAFEDGHAKGMKQGELKKLITLICRKKQKSKTPEVIAEDLEEDLEQVKRIYDIADEFAPEYDAEKIYTKLMS